MTDNAFKINGTLLSHQPTKHSWQPRESIGVDGNGRAIYPSPREYSLEWDLLSASEFNEVYGYYLLVGNTGTVSVDLPQWPPVSSYQFRTYSGAILREPTYSEYFENYFTDVKLLVVRITT